MLVGLPADALPFQLGQVLGQGHVQPQGRQLTVEQGRIPVLGQAGSQGLGAPYRYLPVVRVFGDLLDMPVVPQHLGGAFRAPAGNAGDAVGAIPHEAQVVGDGMGQNAEFLPHPGLVPHHVLAPVQGYHPVGSHHLRQILVRRAEHHLLHAGRVPPAVGRGAQGIIGLNLHHRPDHEPQAGCRLFRQLELAQQFRRRILSGLVAGEQIVAKGADNAVKGAGDVGHVGLPQQGQQGLYQAAYRSHLPPVRGADGGQGKVGPEQLEGAVNQVYFHSRPCVTHMD